MLLAHTNSVCDGTMLARSPLAEPSTPSAFRYAFAPISVVVRTKPPAVSPAIVYTYEEEDCERWDGLA